MSLNINHINHWPCSFSHL